MSEACKGKDRLVNSVGWNWASHLVFIIAGFVLPRSIDTALGQEALGIWDFAWSIVGYLSLMQFGLGSSVNRYVAKHKATGDVASLNRSVSSVVAVQTLMGIVIILLAALVAYGFLTESGRVPENMSDDVQILVVTLGMSLAIRTAFGAYDGVITGLHRWDVYNLINSGFHAVTIAMMVAALKFGFGLRALGITYLAGSSAMIVVRAAAAHRIYPDLDIKQHNVTWETIVEMTKFSGKSFVSGLARTILYQSNLIIVGLAMGPAALAVYSRPLSLVTQSSAFVSKLANPLTPIIGAAQADSKDGEVSSIALAASRVSATLSLSGMVILAWVGGDFIQWWMGDEYRNDSLIAILAIGHVFTIAHLPVSTTLIGLNAHGVPALISAGAAILATVAAVIGLQAETIGLTTAAIILAVTNTMSDGLLIPRYACSKLGLRLPGFYAAIWTRALMVAAPILVSWLASVVGLLPDELKWVVLTLSLSISALIFARVFRIFSILNTYWNSKDWHNARAGR